MRCPALFAAVLLLAACGGSSEVPEGTFQGEGANSLVLEHPQWSLRTGRVLWSGTYRIEGDRLILRTEDVEPAAGHSSDCLGAEETYGWALDGSELNLSFQGEPCSQNRWAVLTSFPWDGGEQAK